MEQVVFIGLGFGIVMGVLTALWGVCALVGTAFKRIEAAREAAVPAPVSIPAPEIAEGIPPAHVAAIAAAVASLSGAWRIRRVEAPVHVSRAWAAQGRFELQTKWQAYAAGAPRLRLANPRNDGHGE